MTEDVPLGRTGRDLQAKLDRLRLQLGEEEEKAEAFGLRAVAARLRGDWNEVDYLRDWARTVRVEVLRLQVEIAAVMEEIRNLQP
jgi:hypothetical protein